VAAVVAAAVAAAAAAAADRLAMEESILVQMMAHQRLEQAIIEQFQLSSQQNILKKKVS